MSEIKGITVRCFYDEQSKTLGLKLVAGQNGLSRMILEPTVNRPGLALAGFTKYYAFRRIQVIGNAECSFLRSLPSEERVNRYETLLKVKTPCVIFSRNLTPEPALLKVANKFKVPVFRSPLITMKLINLATLAMESMFAPRKLEYGGMVDILGIGVIIRGESGIGKSECALALLERGYSLVSDDITRLTVSEGRGVIGMSPENTRNFMEVRGIGIINVTEMFGIRAIRKQKRVDLVVTLKAWEASDEIERVGLEDQYYKLLGINIPHIVIPVRPGRDIARLVEVAALQTKLKQTGKNPAQEFEDQLIARMNPPSNLKP